jgi:hypothetical protein
MAAFNISGVQDWGAQLWRRRNRMAEVAPINKRREIRFFSTTSVQINLGGKRKVGLLRDISSTGVFLYSDFAPQVDEVLEFSFKLPNEAQPRIGITCRGCVVRVEDKHTGAAIGMGIKLLECRLTSR